MAIVLDSISHMIEYFFENFNHSMPESLNICQFQCDLINRVKLFLREFSIVVPDVCSSV